jgi:hypothetical protein
MGKVIDGRPAARSKRKSAPSGERPLFDLDPNYPVKPWVETKTATTFATVTARQEDGKFISIIAEYPEIRAIGETQAEAESQAKAAFVAKLRSPERVSSDEGLAVRPEIIDLANKRFRRGKFMTADEARKRYGIR